MDFTKVLCISEKCKGKNVIMNGAGASFGGRVNYSNLKCPVCETKIMIMPLLEKYEYSITATTKEEREKELIRKATEESQLQLARTIMNIKETAH